ncbi:MAG TPA: colanic acid exporter [Bacteroidales bacterium]|jgi:O-antigen/teichoic acid export membrane protein|nr:colanic acid exporter [Bacteroidales bacterium]
MSSLKQKTVSGLIWSFVDTMAGQGITFIVGIILARLLSPREFGLIGMLTVFIAVSQSFIDSGFSNALIRKKDCSDADYSTVFYFNLAVGVLFFILLYFSAPAISGFFNEPELTAILQVMGIVLIIDSLTIIQRTILTKRIDFKLQARISVIASIGSGIVAIAMAFNGFGVWALVAQRIVKQGLNSLFLWMWNRWKPLLVFSVKSFKELFGFGSKLLISGLIDTVYRNVYYLIIGKFFSAQELGFYTKAEEFNRLPSQNLNSIIGRVTYPVLSTLQDDIPRLRNNYQKLIRSVMFITFILMLGMAAVAEPMIHTLIGAKWEPAIIYLQMLCFVGMMYPLHALNLNMLQVQGRSDLFLKLEIIKKIIAVPTIIIGIFFGIKMMIVGMMVNTLIAYYLNSYWSGVKIGYSFKQQVKDIAPSFILAFTMGVAVYFIGDLLPFSYLINLIIQILFGAIFVFVFCEITKFKDYIFVKELVLEKIQKNR